MPVILGGGIGGLSAAHYLLKYRNKLVQSIKLLESSNRYGGWIDSQKRDGFIFESGPRTLRPSGIPGSNTLSLLEELNLECKIHPILSTSPAAKNRMIYVNKTLHSLPSNFSHAFKTLSPFSKPLVSSILHDIFEGRSKVPLNDESIYDFANRRFGKEVADFLISSMICGICAGDAKEISVKFLMADMFKNEQKYGGAIKGMVMKGLKTKKPDIIVSKLAQRANSEKWSIYSLDGGLETLPLSLVNELKKENIDTRLNEKCVDIEFQENKVLLRMSNNDQIESDYVISSIPSYSLANLVSKQHPQLENLLNSIPYVDVALINLQYNVPNLIKKQGFGFLIPPCENVPLLGVIFDSCCFDMNNNTVLTVMMGGKWFNQYFGKNPTEEELMDISQKYLKIILNIDIPPNSHKVHVLRKCIAQYTVGHHDRVHSIEKYINENKLQLGIVGSSYYGVGVNDVILSSKNLVKNHFA